MDARSEKNLLGVKPDLVAVVRLAADKADELNNGLRFIVTEGMRTATRQAELVKAGASRTMNSKHLTGDAVDLAATVNGTVRWDWPLYDQLSKLMFSAADELGVVIEWGGNWRSFRDGPHFQLSNSKKA
jgi:peptidoglycan LD-endopeptidase CwlK